MQVAVAGGTGYLGQSLSDAMEKLIMCKELREKMDKADREKVVKEFSDGVITGRVIKLYEEVLQNVGKER